MTKGPISDPHYLDHDLEYWVKKLGDPDPLGRRLAAHALNMMAGGAGAATLALEGALEDPEGFVRVWAAAALLAIVPEHDGAWSTLREHLDDPQHFVRSLAAWHLGRLGLQSGRRSELRRELERHLQDPDPSVRLETAVALRRL